MVSAVWGDWHVSMMLDANFPTLLAPGNLPSLAEKHDVEFLLFTTPEDKRRIESSAAYQRVRELITVNLDTNLFRTHPGNSPVIHHEAWIIAKDRAEKEGGLVWNMLPDVMFADDSLGHVGDLIASGKQAVMWFYPRAVAETFVPDARQRWAGEDSVLAIPGREMLELNLQHLHPVMMAYMADSPYFPNHPELIVWPVPGEGLLVRMLINVYNVFDPNLFELTDQQLPADKHDPDEYEFITDSDRLFGVSLAPLGKDNVWYNRARVANPISVARWWLEFDSPANDQVASHRIQLHVKELDRSLWSRRERASDLFFSKVTSAREGVRIAQLAQEMGCRQAASVIILALETGAFYRAFSRLGSALVFLPDDDAIERLDSEFMTRILAPGSTKLLVEFLRNHVVFVDHSPVSFDEKLEDAQSMDLVSAAGGALTIRRDGNDFLINDLPVLSGIEQAGMHGACRIDGILAADSERG